MGVKGQIVATKCYHQQIYINKLTELQCLRREARASKLDIVIVEPDSIQTPDLVEL